MITNAKTCQEHLTAARPSCSTRRSLSVSSRTISDGRYRGPSNGKIPRRDIERVIAVPCPPLNHQASKLQGIKLKLGLTPFGPFAPDPIRPRCFPMAASSWLTNLCNGLRFVDSPVHQSPQRLAKRRLLGRPAPPGLPAWSSDVDMVIHRFDHQRCESALTIT